MNLKNWLYTASAIVLCLALVSGAYLFWNTAIAPIHALTVRIDGQPVDTESRATTVEALLEDMSIHVNKGDIISPKPNTKLADGMEIKIDTQKLVCLDVDGVVSNVKTNCQTVEEMLDDEGIKFEKDDLVTPGAADKVRDGQKVIVKKAVVSEVIERIAIKKKEIKKDDDTVLRGSTKTIKEGRDGEIEIRYKVCMRDGKELYREKLGEQVSKQAVDKVIAVGTKPVTLASRHNEPPAETPAQTPVPENNESGALANSEQGAASYYTLNGKGIGMTAAHKTLPFGTKVKVTNLNNGKTVTVTINDRGPYVKGRVIDLATDAFRCIAPTSAGVCPVKLEW